MPSILTLPRAQAPALPESGCWAVSDVDFLHPPLWQSRACVEHDERYLQPITYLLLFNALGQVWCYQRTGGDARLDGRCSVGVGGHVDAADQAGTATLTHALLRELGEELQAAPGQPAGPQHLSQLRLRALVYEGRSAVGRVHLGVVYTAQWLPAQAPQPRAGEKLASLGFQPPAQVANDSRFELWSRLATQHLSTPQP